MFVLSKEINNVVCQLVKNKVRFSAYHVTKLVREKFPNENIPHAEVRPCVHDLMKWFFLEYDKRDTGQYIEYFAVPRKRVWLNFAQDWDGVVWYNRGIVYSETQKEWYVYRLRNGGAKIRVPEGYDLVLLDRNAATIKKTQPPTN